jgi:hypothetical protein
MRKKEYRSFNEARKYVRSFKFKNISEYNKWFSKNKPLDIPLHPERAYPKEFEKNGKWRDWLGNVTIIFWPFKKARKFVRELKLKNASAWNVYRKSGNKPDEIPSTPNIVYKNDGWVDLPDWLGNGNLSNKGRIYQTYEECQKFAQKNSITSQIEWEKFGKSGKRPLNVPSHPERVFSKQWTTWPDFFGVDRIANQNRTFKSYKDAKIFAISLNLKGEKEWQKYTQTNKIPKDIPAAPSIFYKKQGTWVSWGDFLGTGTVANQNKEYLPIKEAKIAYKKLFKEYGIVRGSDWPKFAKTHKKLLEELHLPADVLVFYSKEKAEKSLKK